MALAKEGLDYEPVNIEGLECFKMKYNEMPCDSNEAEKEKQRRKKVKDDLGAHNINVPMLDRRNVKGIHELCDAIMIVDYTDKWDKAIHHHCEDMKYIISSPNEVPGGYQIVVRKGDVLYMTLSIYPAKKKIMMQPGERKLYVNPTDS